MNKSVVKIPSKGSLTPSKRNCNAISSNPPAKSIKISTPPCQGKIMGKTLDVEEEEEWVTVYGFRQRDIKLVLGEFEKCGWILEHVAGSDAANWVHILYQNRSDAQIALRKSGMQMNKDVIFGVKTVDPIRKQELDEERIKKQASGANRQAVDPARIERALNQSLHLLHRSEGDFFVLGETGNVYTVTLSRIPSCSCPDWNTPCKHMLFVLLRVLGISRSDDCLQSKTLKQCQVARLLNTPSSPRTLAGARACEKFRHLYSTMSNVGPPQKIPLKIGQKCPYCGDDLNEAASYDSAVECEACHEVGHESCMVTSKVRRGGENCKSCWAKWSAVSDASRYLNLNAYASESEDDQDSEDASEYEDEGESDEDDQSDC